MGTNVQLSTFELDYRIERTEQRGYQFYKRVIDVIVAVMALLLLSPVFLVLACVIKLDSKGPVMFKQARCGKGGSVISVNKFRTMRSDAEHILRSNRVLFEKYVESGYKLLPNEDPRITRIGKILRRTSLDELPQLLNVLRGDMSLVGPRPVIVDELEEYGPLKGLFLSAKPGITGYWQTHGRSNVGYPERISLELYYVVNQSILLDLSILWATFLNVLKGEGAY